MADSWMRPDNPADDEARRIAFQRLTDAAHRAGLSIERLHKLLEKLQQNEAETRRFLADEVYGVSDDLLDDLLRVKLSDAVTGDRNDGKPDKG